MRFKHKMYKEGDKWTVTRFLWWPKRINYETRWLERATWEEEVYKGHGYIPRFGVLFPELKIREKQWVDEKDSPRTVTDGGGTSVKGVVRPEPSDEGAYISYGGGKLPLGMKIFLVIFGLIALVVWVMAFFCSYGMLTSGICL